ncbi:MAG: MFS transporter [Bacteroidia bacterium]|nr:MFS transporter [Bacteroidia bacterium]MDW8302578.1 MFS transporter [Bacteroidia bacterium]
MAKLPLNQPKELRAWVLYDWANSVYSLVIATAIFPIYYESVVKEPLSFLGVQWQPTAIYTFAIMIAYFFVLFLSPLLGGIADAKGYKKPFLMSACYIGSLSSIGLFLFDSDFISLGIFLFSVATFGFAMSDTFYNAFLPEIATPDKFDMLSARGYSLGYIGSVILLVISLVFIQKPELVFGGDTALATRFSFVMTGLWWLVFGTWVFTQLRNPEPLIKEEQGSILTKGWKEVLICISQVRKKKVIFWYLIAFLSFNMAVQTIMYMATLFGTNELKLSAGDLIPMLLAIQLIGIIGAYVFAMLSKRYGNISVLRAALVVWASVCVYAYFTTTKVEFYVLGVLVGLCMGGTQSTSRAFYAKIIPQDIGANASFFGFYALVDKLAIVIGMALFGLLIQITHSMRTSIIFLISFFLLGIFTLFVVQKHYQKAYE